MKTIKLVFALMIATVSCAQGSYGNDDKRFTISINTEPNAIIKDGFNFGANIDYQMDKTYFKAGFYTFPDLNNVGYTQLHGAVGFNKHLGMFQDSRVYLGVLLGVNFREGNRNPIAGVEGGYQYYLTESIGLGLMASYIYRSDSEFYEGDMWIFNGGVEVIFVL